MALNYTTYISQIANLLVISSADSNFGTMIPGMIDYAEQRIYRELNLLNTTVRNSTGQLTPNSRTFSIPSSSLGSFVTVTDVNVITPSSLTLATGGVRNQVNPAALALVDYLYPSEVSSGVSVPSLFAMVDQSTVVVGPPPDAAYFVEVVGTYRPAPLSVTNSSTFLASNLPDLFIAASMVFGSGYTRDFSAQGDNPQQGVAWEAQYQQLFQSAVKEEVRKKYNAMFVSQYEPQPTSGGAV